MRKIFVVGTILIVALIATIYFYYSKAEENRLMEECLSQAKKDRMRCFPPPGGFVLCKVNESDEIVFKTENISEADFHYGERIMYSVDLSGISRLKEEYYPCVLYDKFTNVTEFRCIEESPSDFSKTFYVNNRSQVFVCWLKPVTPQTKIIFFYKGNIPNKTKINLVEFYVFPLNVSEVSIEYFWSHLNEARKIYSLYGEVK